VKRLAAWIAGAVALGIMLIGLPWDRLSCPPTLCSSSTSYGGLGMFAILIAIELAILIAILTAIFVGVLGVRDANEPRDVAVMAALGQTRAAAVRKAAATAGRHAAIGIGGAYVLTGILQLAVLAKAGWPLLTTDADLWLVRLAEAAVVCASLVLAHAIDATRPRRTPVERLYEDLAVQTPRRVSLRLRASIIGGLGAASAGLVVGLALAHNQATGDAYSVVKNTASISLAVLAVALCAMLLTVVNPWARAMAPLVLRSSAVIAHKLRAPRLAVILDSRAGTTSAVAGRIVGVLATMAFLVASVASGPTSPALSNRYAETITFGTTGNPQTSIDYYRAIDGVGTIVVGRMQESRGVQQPILINPDDLRGVDETLRGLLLLYPTAVIGGCRLSADSHRASGFVPSGVFLLDTGCGAYVNGSAVTFTTNAYGLLVYAKPGVDIRLLATRLNNTSPPDTGNTFLGHDGAGSSSNSWVAAAVEGGMLFILVIVPMAALSVGVARRRRRDDATLAALGALPRTLRAAVVVEATVVSAFSIAIGLAWGALGHVIATVNFARISLGGVITDDYLRWTLSSVAWVPLLMIGAGAVVVFAVSAAIAARALQRRTPVENHRPVNSGVLS
jgi:hypothetical protein